MILARPLGYPSSWAVTRSAPRRQTARCRYGLEASRCQPSNGASFSCFLWWWWWFTGVIVVVLDGVVVVLYVLDSNPLPTSLPNLRQSTEYGWIEYIYLYYDRVSAVHSESECDLDSNGRTWSGSLVASTTIHCIMLIWPLEERLKTLVLSFNCLIFWPQSIRSRCSHTISLLFLFFLFFLFFYCRIV